MTLIKALLVDRGGASAAEYAIILAIVGTGVALAAALLGESIAGAMNSTSTCISSRVCG
jgi:pilus assembly protein Flp/PilA